MSLKGKFATWFIEGKLPNFVYHLIGRKISDKLKEEGIMAEETEVKSKWKSKTVWVAVIGVIIGAVQPISTALGHPIVVPQWVLEVLAASGLYALRTATTDLK